jgi:chromosome segregation ATPase
VALTEECAQLEETVRERLARRDELQQRARELNQQLMNKDEQLAELDRAARRLASKLEEEKRLRSHVNEIAAEVNDAQLRYESERATQEQSIADLEKKRDRVREHLLHAEQDVQRIRESGAADIDAMNRKVSALRTEIAEKESALQSVTRENAQKQAAIADFEEERRRMEREALARKAAAAHAAKAALTELSF